MRPILPHKLRRKHPLAAFTSFDVALPTSVSIDLFDKVGTRVITKQISQTFCSPDLCPFPPSRKLLLSTKFNLQLSLSNALQRHGIAILNSILWKSAMALTRPGSQRASVQGGPFLTPDLPESSTADSTPSTGFDKMPGWLCFPRCHAVGRANRLIFEAIQPQKMAAYG